MTLLFLTNAVVDSVQQLADTANHAAQQILRFGDLLLKGGWVMVPIGILAILGLVIFFERYFTIRKAAKNESHLMIQIRDSIHSGNLQSAMAICRNSDSPLGRMLQKGVLRIGRPIKDIEGAIENVGKIEVSKLEKNIGILGIVAGIAPMFGFLGTIAGVIKIFYNISQTDNFSMRIWMNPNKMASYRLTPADVISALSSQNVYVAAGSVGAPPQAPSQAFETGILVNGMLNKASDYQKMIIKTIPGTGKIVYLRDVARVELGKFTFSSNSFVDG